MLEMLMELVGSQVAEKVVSKLDGNKNWMIHTEVIDGKPRIRFAGRTGQGELYRSCFVWEIQKYHYRWYYFTYKKDYKEALEALLSLGFEKPLW
jgi:hypothetical protein